ncbi:MAG TPA: DUF2254 domain-containing protein [Methanophagales archaeon]|nr:DUF2254 domain-containing protein [Methanophagales archaeon]
MKRFALENQERIVIPAIIGCFFILIMICLTDIIPFSVVNEDINNARGILGGVGVEGLSAIFAIVISLTLMAVQFASQEYTHRIMDIHIKSLIFWSLIVIYTGSLLYNVFMLGMLEEPVNSKYVEVSMLLTALCLILLIPYFFFTMLRLRPESVISRLLTKIDVDYLNSLKGLIKEATIKSESDRMLPIIEIIEKSIINGDASTARFGLDEINGCYLRYLTEENEAYVSPYFLNHILGVGRAAIIAANDDSMLHVLRIFSGEGIQTITKRMDRSTKMVLENIGIIGFKVLKDYDAATQQLADSLRGMLRAIMGVNNCNEEILTQIFALYRNALDELFALKKERMISYMLNSFSGLLDLMVENKRYEMIGRTTELLERTGVKAVSFDVRDAIHQSVQSLHKIGISFAKDASALDSPEVAVNIAESTIDYLLKIEGETLKYKSRSKEFDVIINEIEYAKKDIEKYIEKGVDFSDLWGG